MLGLVTGKDPVTGLGGNVVLVNPTLAEIAHPEIPTKDIKVEIDASIVTLNGCFELQDFDKFLKSDLIMYGGLACKYYGPNGVFDWSGHLVAGYFQQQIYDERLENLPPPCYSPARDDRNRICYYKMSFAEIQ